jgi:uncharacterized protein YjiS (DUF1127 family)
MICIDFFSLLIKTIKLICELDQFDLRNLIAIWARRTIFFAFIIQLNRTVFESSVYIEYRHTCLELVRLSDHLALN